MNTNKLTAIESSSQAHAAELLLIRSNVAAVETPLSSIRDQLPLLQGSVDTTAHLVASQSRVITHRIQESSQVIRQDFHQANDTIELQLRQQQDALGRVEQLLEKLQRRDKRRQPKKVLAARAASKPAALRELCDSIQAPKQNRSQGFLLDKSACISQNRAVDPFYNSPFMSTTGRRCICHQHHRLTANRGVQLGHMYLSSKTEIQGHWPSCPLSNIANRNRRAVSLKYFGLARMLNSVIDITFAWTTGAGGFSISPNFTYYPTVDTKSAPAFRIMDLLQSFCMFCRSGKMKPFMATCLTKLVRLFNEKKAHPAAVGDHNETLIYAAGTVVRL